MTDLMECSVGTHKRSEYDKHKKHVQIMENKSFTYAEFLEIVDNDEFWKYFEPEEDTASDNISIPTTSTSTNDSKNRNPACGQLFNKGDESDFEETDAEEMSEHGSVINWELDYSGNGQLINQTENQVKRRRSEIRVKRYIRGRFQTQLKLITKSGIIL
ncbi:hypothetical protein FQA39_LY03983 [Lamprigera yunnana]|nr:hypothetical protein FQA39_LY03983 [Lamprigera yunnana]